MDDGLGVCLWGLPLGFGKDKIMKLTLFKHNDFPSGLTHKSQSYTAKECKTYCILLTAYNNINIFLKMLLLLTLIITHYYKNMVNKGL